MILSVHMIASATLAAGAKNPGEAIMLGLISHYFLDSLPHIEYKIGGIEKGDLKNSAKEFAKIAFDIFVGLAIMSYIAWNAASGQWTLIIIGTFFGILPDGFVFMDYAVKNKGAGAWFRFLGKHQAIHKTIHSKAKNLFAVIPSQIAVAGVLIYFLFK